MWCTIMAENQPRFCLKRICLGIYAHGNKELQSYVTCIMHDCVYPFRNNPFVQWMKEIYGVFISIFDRHGSFSMCGRPSQHFPKFGRLFILTFLFDQISLITTKQH